jgi:serine/threonine-protein kinase
MARKRASRKPVLTCPSCGCDADPAGGAVNFCPGCGMDLRGRDASTSSAFVHRVVADRYRLLALVGEGGMGAVYRAEHIRMGKALALKILRGDFAREPGAFERFLAEARIVSRLSHPHTIAVFDFGEIDDRGSGFYLAMEYVPGRDLAAELREAGPLPEHRVAAIGQQILGSLAEAHDAGIVHRDVKPGNVMLMSTRSGEDFVKVLDFGIAKLREPGAELDATSTTAAAAIVGTPSYLAPEQARGAPADARADLYAVGCLLYELVAGRPPFAAPTPMAVVAAHLREQPAPLATLAPGVSRRLAEVIHRALRKRPEERFPSADAMREALGRASEPTGSRALAPERRGPQLTGELRIASREDFADLDRQIRALRRGRVLAPLAALAVAAALGLAAWRRGDVWALVEARAPALAAAIPEALRPPVGFDGREHEPNDLPTRANPLPLPPGPDGAPAGGTVTVRGRLGAKPAPTGGDADVYRLELPPADRTRVLVAEWRGERPGGGSRGRDAALALNRERTVEEGPGIAPLVASVDRGAAGDPERLVAAVGAGVHYLSVRERPAAGRVEEPVTPYVLEVRLADPEPGREVEPNDGPERTAGLPAYPAWRAIAERNALVEGAPVRGEVRGEDADLFAVAPPGAGDAPGLVAAVPVPGLALAARLWNPDADFAAAGARERARLAEAGDAEPGHVLLVRLAAGPPAGAPALVQLRAAAGEGGYEVVALGRGAASGGTVLALVDGLAAAGRAAAALELAAAFVRELRAAPAREEVCRLAGDVAERAAAATTPDGLAAFDRASQLLGAAVLEVEDGRVRYRGAFAAADAAAPAE